MAHFVKPGRQYGERIEHKAADLGLPKCDGSDRNPHQQDDTLSMGLVGKHAGHRRSG
jgi:hypothetical protein